MRVDPLWSEPVLLSGAVRRLTGSAAGALPFLVEVAAVRVGSPPVLRDEAAYAAARPDPLRHDAPDVLRHLNEGHSDALTACLCAGGHEVAFAQAVRLDSGGLTAVAVRDDGMDTVRLRFPAPVTSLSELPPSLALVLRPSCGCCRSRRER